MGFSATDWQKEIYLSGFAGNLPAVPMSFAELEAAAERVMSPQAFAYVSGGAGAGSTMDNNMRSFQQLNIAPRMLCNVSERNTSIHLFGQRLASPLLIAPIGVLELAHAQADLAVARAAAALKMPYIFSNQASFAMEHCAREMGDSPRWFQLYWSKSRDLIASFVRRAEACGCTAIVVTLDTTLLGWRTRDLSMAYLPFLEGKGIAQYTSDPVFQKLMDEEADGPEIRRQVTYQSIAGLVQMVNRYPGSGFFRKLKSGRPIKAVRKFVATYSNPAATWEDLGFLRELTKLPILLKGILRADDALRAVDAGMDGIIVSNHGGRQVDGAIGAVAALPSIVNAVGGHVPILLDSGVRSGADVFKALALGATAVCVGRPYVYGLAIAGETGVKTVLNNFAAEFELTMALSGCKTISEIGRDCLC